MTEDTTEVAPVDPVAESVTDVAPESAPTGSADGPVDSDAPPAGAESDISDTAEQPADGSEPADEQTVEPADELVDEGEVAADYLEGLLDIGDLDGDIDITVENDRASVSVIEVNRGDLAHLVGADAKVLSALQDLTRLAVTRETGRRSRLMLDIAGHRATRRTELQRIAKDSIEQARQSGEPVRMTAMSPFERKVVHDEVAAAGLTSESEGTEPRRYVVILPA